MKVLPILAWCHKYAPKACASGMYPLIREEDDDQILYAIAYASSSSFGSPKPPPAEEKIGPLPDNVMAVYVPLIKMDKWSNGPVLVGLNPGCYIGDIDHMMLLKRMLDSVQNNLAVSVKEIEGMLTH